MAGDGEPAQAVLVGVEIRRHAALAADAAAERNADEIAFEIVGPLVIGADEFLGRSRQLAAEFRGAMGAAVFEHVDRAVLRARHHDRRRPDIGADEIAGIRHLGFERHVVPGVAVEDAFDLALVDELVGVDPIRNDAEIVAGPHIVADKRRAAIGMRAAVWRGAGRSGQAFARRRAVFAVSVMFATLGAFGCTTPSRSIRISSPSILTG